MTVRVDSMMLKVLTVLGWVSDEDPDETFTELNMVWRLVRNIPPTFIWAARREGFDFRRLHRDQLVSRFPRATFTTKVSKIFIYHTKKL